MTNKQFTELAPNTPIIIGAGQYCEKIAAGTEAPLHSPMQLAARAAQSALRDAGGSVSAADIDTIATIRLFSDSAPLWACPFGASDNPPQSIAAAIGASPQQRIYSDTSGTQPLQVLMELFTSIARGEKQCALLAGAEAIANQRHAQRNGLNPDWHETFDLSLDNREPRERFASTQELHSGMSLPVHYYALIENCRAQQQGHSLREHQQYMARLLAPFSSVAASNPLAMIQQTFSSTELALENGKNYAISLPYLKHMVAQDAVNQSAALLLTSVGKARQLGIDPGQWIFVQGYAEGMDQFLTERADPGGSQVMNEVMSRTLNLAQARSEDMDLVDIYSCFPCAVDAACDALGLPVDGSTALTVTGGLPFFGGPGNNYSMHALAEMTVRLRNTKKRALVTANGGVLSKHAAVVMANAPAAPGAAPLALAADGVARIDRDSIRRVPSGATPTAGRVISFTVIYQRNSDDLGLVLGETADGERFLASSTHAETVAALQSNTPVGRSVNVEPMPDQAHRHQFNFTD